MNTSFEQILDPKCSLGGVANTKSLIQRTKAENLPFWYLDGIRITIKFRSSSKIFLYSVAILQKVTKMKYECPRARIHGGVANTESLTNEKYAKSRFFAKNSVAASKHQFCGSYRRLSLLETFLDCFWMISMCSDSGECFYDGQSSDFQ